MSRIAWVTLGIVLAVGLGAAVWLRIGPDDLQRRMAAVEWPWMLASAGFFLATLLLRTYRLRLMLGETTSFRCLFETTCQHSLANVLLPIGLGDGLLTVLLKRRQGVRYGVGTAFVVTVRAIDLVLLVLVSGSAFLVYDGPLPEALALSQLGPRVSGLALALFSILLLGFVIGARVSPRARKALADLGLALRSMGGKALSSRLLLLSGAIWLSLFLRLGATLRALGMDLSWQDVLFLYMFVALVHLSPARGIANFGTYEGAWFVSFRLLGFDASIAATTAFGSHFLNLGVLLLIAGLPAVLALVRPRNIPPAASVSRADRG